MTKEMFEWITKWQRETFTKATAQSAANHLREEVNELILELGFYSDEKKRSEYADCFLLLFGSAALYGLSYDDICRAINDKMEINKQRQWGVVNGKGYVNHCKFKKGEVVYLESDENKEPYTVEEYTGEFSKGPIGQLDKSPVVKVLDGKKRHWQFREDSLANK